MDEFGQLGRSPGPARRAPLVLRWAVRTLLSLQLGLAGVPAIAAAQTAAGPEFRVTQSTPIGGEGSWDYAQYDAASGRLFVTRVGGVLVIDTATMKSVGSIPAYAGTRVHGIAIGRPLGLGVTSDGADKSATVFDLTTLKVVRRIPLAHAPDSIVFDPASGDAVAFGVDDPDAMALNPVTGKTVADIVLPGSPEAGVADGRGSVYVDLSDTNEIARLDTRSWKVEAHWAIGGGCKEPTPLDLDRTSARLFIGCRSGVLAVVDPSRQSLVASLPIGAGADAVVFDNSSKLIFVSCNDGTLSIFKEVSPDRFEAVQTVATAFSARTMALDPRGMRVFLPVADRGPMLPKVGDIPSRPAIVPETFRILTVSR